MSNFGILTISDRGARGERADESGKSIRGMLIEAGGRIARYEIVPDDVATISAKLAEWSDSHQVDAIITTGGTGLGPRDVTPEATLKVVDRLVPGLGEAMRAGTVARTPTAVLSRAVAGTRGKCLIINLPGSPKGVRECLEIVLPVIPHAIGIINCEITEHVSGKEGHGAH